MGSGVFGTAVNCMDGRVQLPVNAWLRSRFGVDYVDTVTEAGPIRELADDPAGTIARSIRARLTVSVEKHGSGVVAVVGHHDCAGNPVDRDEQARQTRAAVELVKSWFPGVRVVGLWVTGDWEAVPLE